MRRITVLAGVLALVASVTAASFSGTQAVAHPPENPFDNTRFAPIRTGGVKIGLERVTAGLTAPVKGVVAPGHPGRLFVIEQDGQLVSVDLAGGQQTVVLDLSERLVPLGVGGPGTFDERGFLGTAFHPDYASNGLLYTYSSERVTAPPTFPTTMPPGSAPNHQNVLAEWRVPNPADPRAAVDPASRRELIRVDWPQFNHNGGDIAFGPDRLLYVPTGDGGGADDQNVGHPGGNAQNPTVPLGKILRIDVNARDSANGQYGIPARNIWAGMPGLVGEIFALGFRNPWRLSFDRGSGRLYVGDVGQNDLEEVSIVVNGGNYGWPLKEGRLFFNNNGTLPGFAVREPVRETPPGLQDPIAQYDTHHEGHSVIGGYVYRGHRVPQLRGRYVFADFSRLSGAGAPGSNYGRILYLSQDNRNDRHDRSGVTEVRGFAEEAARLGLIDPNRPPAAFPQTLAVFGVAEDARGELYVTGNLSGVPFGTGGVVLRITAR
ncbi:MAG TPA: PQQ-dependent sugar dehydrogenase [Actinophytocola sp.]|uniref:PQQ-dependent sugar dehydrogenase n=1 Tax=Actinophytocola sp. TaxID=1872138 RepID=UPI002DB82B19|nr:PQQ-dependent sugar dehydrogenase [Actinophytocola sp.]HEU5473416.1 PQQ-dependent sugar dehydrogenase [Actinophytocola sp.]